MYYNAISKYKLILVTSTRYKKCSSHASKETLTKMIIYKLLLKLKKLSFVYV